MGQNGGPSKSDLKVEQNIVQLWVNLGLVTVTG